MFSTASSAADDARRRPAECFDGQVGVLAEASHYASRESELLGVFASGVAAPLRADLVQILEYVAGEACFVLRAGHGFPEELYDRERVPAGLLSQAGRALLDPRGRAVTLADFSVSHDWADDDLMREHGARSGVVHKVATDAKAFGALGVFWRVPHELSEEESRFLERAAGLLSAGIARLDRRAAAAAWRSRSGLLSAGTALLKVPAERDAVLFAATVAGVNGASDRARPMADWCMADALETGGRRPKIVRAGIAHAGGNGNHLKDSFSEPLLPTAPHGTARIYATRKPELIRRCGEAFVSAVSRDDEHRRAVEEARPFSYMCVPVAGIDRFYGALTFLRTEEDSPAPYDEEDLAVCAEFGDLVAAAIERGLPAPDLIEAQEAMRDGAAAELDLTEREQQVLAGIASGQQLRRIGAEHNISPSTVRGHKRQLCLKLGLTPSVPDVQIIAEARRHGAPGLPG